MSRGDDRKECLIGIGGRDYRVEMLSASYSMEEWPPDAFDETAKERQTS